MVDGDGDSFGLEFGAIGPGAGVPFIDGGTPKFEPAFEEGPGKLDLFVQFGVRDVRVPAVRPAPKKHGLPEIAHGREVGVQIHPGDVGKDRSEQIIGLGTGVEGNEQGANVIAIGDIRVVHGYRLRKTISASKGSSTTFTHSSTT